MEFKDYQRRVLERFTDYLAVLATERQDAVEFFEFQASKGRETVLADFSRTTWDKLKTQGILPRAKTPQGLVVPEYVARHDGAQRSIPHICLKVPTGGGKTLLAAECVGKLQTELLKRQVGLVLWIVPTVQIYNQTKKALFNREHPYRQSLERASGGRVKVFEKDDPLFKADVENYLCVMLVRLAAANRQSGNEFLKIFRDSGKYTSFFPEVDAPLANEQFRSIFPDLHINDLADAGPHMLSIKHSLLNVLKISRPIVVVDEGHKAYSDNTRTSLNNFNPSFILELSATPNVRAHNSNILVEVSGVDLKDEQMIKLPINIINKKNDDWRSTLTRAFAKRNELEDLAIKLQESDGRYIRPIMVVRVERTGKDQRDGIKIHALDAKDYLINTLNVREECIRIKSSDTDELGSDDLLDPLSQVRFIITKEALQEGWDCPFAYVLALLDKTSASTAMTQMVGRVLRQPDTRTTSIDELNQCYIYCFDQVVNKAVENVRHGLEEEGMTGLAEFVREGNDAGGNTGGAETAKIRKIRRRDAFKDVQVFLPKVLHQEGKGWREIQYDRDIVALVPWESLRFDLEKFKLDDVDATLSHTTVDVNRKADLFGDQGELDLIEQTINIREVLPSHIDTAFLTRQLMEVIPNPWQAARIVSETVSGLKQRKHSNEEIFTNRLYLVGAMKEELRKVVLLESERIFKSKLSDGIISFKLLTTGNSHLNFTIAHELEVLARENEKVLVKDSNLPIQNSLFEAVFDKDLNGLERSMALYLSDNQAITWWHRMVAKQEYSLQGWQRNKVYPDFLACVNGNRILVMETKGLQLKGSDDTGYKQSLMQLLTEHSDRLFNAGAVEVTDGGPSSINISILMENTWQQELVSLLHE